MGKGTSSTDVKQQSQSDPWAAAQPALKGILGGVEGLIPGAGLSPTSSGAINTLEQNAQAGNPFSGQITGTTNTLLNGGGATAQSGNVNDAYQRYVAQTNPLASNTNYDPMQNPAMRGWLDTIKSDVGNSVNGMFAGAGRDLSGANLQTLSRGIAQGEAPVLAAQYNQNIQNQQGAANNLYQAGNNTAGMQTALKQQDLANRQAGVPLTQQAMAAQNYAPTQLLNLEQLKQSIPAQNLGLLANIATPMGQLGGSSSGSSTQTNNPSLIQQVAGWTNIANSLFSPGGQGGGGQQTAQAPGVGANFAKFLFG